MVELERYLGLGFGFCGMWTAVSVVVSVERG